MTSQTYPGSHCATKIWPRSLTVHQIKSDIKDARNLNKSQSSVEYLSLSQEQNL